MEVIEQVWQPYPDCGVLLYDKGHLIGVMGGKKYEKPKMKYSFIESLERLQRKIPVKVKLRKYTYGNETITSIDYTFEDKIKWLPYDLQTEIGVWNRYGGYDERVSIEDREMAKKLFKSCMNKLDKLKANILADEELKSISDRKGLKYLKFIEIIDEAKITMIRHRKNFCVEEIVYDETEMWNKELDYWLNSIKYE